MTMQKFQAQAEIGGSVSPKFLQSVDRARKAVGGLGDATQGVSADNRRLQSTLDRARRRQDELTAAQERTIRGSSEYRRLGNAIRRVDGVIQRTTRSMARLGRETQSTESDMRGLASVNLRGLRTAITGVLTAAGGFAVVGQARQEFERLNQVLRDAPQLDFGQARQLIRASELIGFDEGSIADVANEFNIRLGEAIADPASRQEFTDAIAAIGLDLNALQAQAPTQQIQTLTEALRGVNDVASRSALADFIAGGQGGQALNFLAANADAARLAFTELNRTPIITPETQARLAEFNADTARLGHSVADVRNALVASAQPAVGAFSDAVSAASRAVAGWAQENRGAALTIGIGAAVLPTAASAFADFGEQAFFASRALESVQRIGGLAANIVPAIGKAAALAKIGVVGLAGGIKAATAAAAAFAVTPIGLTIIGIGAAVAALTAGVVYLADKVGGFKNLAEIAFASVKAAALTFAQGVVQGWKPLAAVIDAMIAAISELKQTFGGSAIEFRVGDAIAAVERSAANARADVARQYRAGVAEGERQQAAGTSVGQRIGGALGFGATPSAEPPIIGATPRSAASSSVSAPSVTNAPVTNHTRQDVQVNLYIDSLVTDEDGLQGLEAAIAGGLSRAR